MADGVGQFGEVGDHGARLFLGTVLPEGDEIIVLAVQKRADVRGVSGERVVGGDGNHNGSFVSKMRLGGEGDGGVSDTVCELCDRVSRAGGDDECV